MIEETESPTPPDTMTVSIAADRVAAEALALELRRLARQHGLDIRSVRVDRGAPADPPPEAEPA